MRKQIEKLTYVAPEAEVVEIAIERGFLGSIDIADDEWNGIN